MNPQATPDQPNQNTSDDKPVEPPVQESVTSAPEPAATTAPETSPAAAETAAPVVVKQPQSRKKLVIIVAAAVAVLLLIVFAVFSMWYNKPENVVSDSFMKLATAKSSQGTAVMIVPSDSGTNTINFSYIQNEAKEASGTVSIASSNGAGSTLDVKGAFALDKDQTVYVKVENLRKTLETLAGSDPSASLYLQMFDSVVDSIDSKWISISQSDLQKLNGTESDDKEFTCVEGKVSEFQKSNAQQNEVRNLFNKHPFLQVTQVGTETVENVYSNHYQLKSDDAKAKEFMKGAKSLTVFKNIDGCVSDDLAKQVDESLSEATKDDSKTTETVDYWVGVWSHEPVKLSMKTTESGKTTSLEIKPKLNTKPTVTIPKADKSIIELQQEITAATSQLYGGLTEPMPLDDL